MTGVDELLDSLHGWLCFRYVNSYSAVGLGHHDFITKEPQFDHYRLVDLQWLIT